MIVWLILGGAVLVVIIAAVLLQKKSGETQKLSDELALTRQERDKMSIKVEELENSFEDKMDKVVQSSIQKIAHAEQAKEEAIQAAQDNYEAAADAHGLLKEKEAIIKELQSNA